MKSIISTLATLLLSTYIFAQVTTTPTVIASTGKYYGTPGQLEVSYTVGEMTAVTTEGNLNGVHLTQGFHQPEEVIINTGLNEQKETPLNFVVYPNPSANTVWLGYEMAESGKTVINLTDLTGKVITTITQQDYANGKNMEHFDVSKMSAGNYLLSLQFTTTAGKHFVSTKQFSVNH